MTQQQHPHYLRGEAGYLHAENNRLREIIRLMTETTAALMQQQEQDIQRLIHANDELRTALATVSMAGIAPLPDAVPIATTPDAAAVSCETETAGEGEAEG